MNDDGDGTTGPLQYTVYCVDCPFETTVEGDAFDVLDVVDAHQEEHANDAFEHFVEFESAETG